MSYLKTATAALAIAIAFSATPALAQTEPGKISISISGGTDFAIGGTMHDGANAPIADLGVLNPALAGVPATLQIERRSQSEVYDEPWAIGGEIGYGLSESGEVLLGVRYLQAKGNRINVGGAAAGAPVNATLPVFGDFGDYKALSIELGYRQYFGSGEGMKPFFAARAGATRISGISADFTVPDADIALNNTPFSKSSWVLSGGADLGISIPIGTGASIEPEVGIRYVGGAKGIDTALGGLGLGAINDKGERWSVPVTVRLKFTM
jgi:hypothetical protein